MFPWRRAPLLSSVVLVVLLLCASCLRCGQSRTSSFRSLAEDSKVGESSRTASFQLPVYWINMDRDADRRKLMEQHLTKDMQFTHTKRIAALTPNTANIIMLEHECKRFSFPDIAILTSHLKAIHTAVHDTSSPLAVDSKYALILEDDIRFQYDINFEELIASAPKNFGVLQLMTSHYDQILNLWNSYRYQNQLWTFRRQDSSIWSAQAYIINKAVYKEYVDAAIEQYDVPGGNKDLKFRIIQTFDSERGLESLFIASFLWL
jgi:GR25 family glycosyltransferase involved in LPS biosynthesis